MLVDWIVGISLVMSVGCFVLYVVQVWHDLNAKKTPDGTPVGTKAANLLAAAPTSISADDIAKMLDSLSKLVDSLAKAGPSLTSLIGAVLFLAIAATAGGVVHITDTLTNKPATETAPPKGGAPPSNSAVPAPTNGAGKAG